MEVQGMNVAPINELTAWVAANPLEGSVSAGINVSTSELVVALAVVALIGVAVIGVSALRQRRGLPRQQGAELALTEDDDGGRLAAGA